ncbi:hypothetical protein FRC11_013077 [Ceratobasidium sp. 423]|nr:hypothetical protein FRC11_013077 [Ceratobasidium sp. 423]
MSFNPNKVERLKQIGQFVVTLYIGNFRLPQNLHQALLNSDSESPLFPNLRRLSACATIESVIDNYTPTRRFKNQYPEWGWIGVRESDIPDIMLLCATPNLELISLFCDGQAIDTETLLRRAPNLTDIRIGVEDMWSPPMHRQYRAGPDYTWHTDAQNLGVFVPPHPIGWSTDLCSQLNRWANLAALTVNGIFISVVENIGHISRLPRLARLAVKDPGEAAWAHFQPDREVFPNLYHLSLYHATLEDVNAVGHCHAITQRVRSLTWVIQRGQENPDLDTCVNGLRATLAHFTLLACLRLTDQPRMRFPPFWAHPNLPQILKTLELEEVHTTCAVNVLETTPSPILAFSSFGERLTRLSLRHVVIPVQLLVFFSAKYPQLEYLRCVVDLVQFDDTDITPLVPGYTNIKKIKPSLPTLDSPPICLLLSVSPIATYIGRKRSELSSMTIARLTLIVDYENKARANNKVLERVQKVLDRPKVDTPVEVIDLT